jgi:transcriptional regulator with XRE-family HTH domain
MTEKTTTGSTEDEDASTPVGQALAQLRRDKGMTGQQLGRLAGVSQAKISRIETGAATPARGDVERIARALGAGPDVVQRLVDQVEGNHNRMTDWRLTASGGRVTKAQKEIAAIEDSTTVFRLFNPTVFSGLLQTAEYARTVFDAVVQAGREGDGAQSAKAVPVAVSARVQRQENLADPGKKFHFVLTEAVLQHLVCHPTDMIAQIHRVQRIAAQGNVSIGLIPATSQLVYLPPHSFAIYDNRVVLVDLINTFVVSRGRSDIQLYQKVFDALEKRVTEDIDPILNRYLDRYLDLARGTGRH